jgi:hypothetical protein
MTREDIMHAQRILGVTADGVFGPRSIAAAQKFVGPWRFRGSPSPGRYVTAVIQTEAKRKGIDAGPIDAFWGPQTAVAAQILRGVPPPTRPDERPAPALRPVCWYPTDAQMIAKYGQPGSNQTTLHLPYPMVLDWYTSSTVTRTQCHRAVADSLGSVLRSVLTAYGIERIRELGLHRFGGVLNVRRKRGGSTWSAHAWGTAIDLFPSQNQLRWTKARAVFARREYDDFRKIFRDHGWMSLGECADFDWMHWQKNP